MNLVEPTANMLAEFSNRISVTASSEGDGFIDFKVDATDLDERFADRKLLLLVGATQVMSLKFPSPLPRADRHFGPARIPISSLRRNTGFTTSLVDEASGESIALPAAFGWRVAHSSNLLLRAGVPG